MRASAFLINNVATNFAYVGLMALITLIVVPLYVHALGPAWSYVALCLTVQGSVFLLDAVISPLMLRDVARAHAARQEFACYQRFLRLYAGLGMLAFVVGEAAVYLVAASNATPADLRGALQLTFVQLLFQFCNSTAIGFWNGTGHQRRANTRLAGFAVGKHAAALALVSTWHTATAYALPFALVGIVECAANHRRLHAGRSAQSVIVTPRSDWGEVRAYVPAALLGLATAQVDRWYLCLALPATNYGIYYLLSSFMLSTFSMQVPIIRAFSPHLATAERPRAAARPMRVLLFALIALPGIVLAAFAPTALALWLHDANIASIGAPTFRVLMLTVVLNAASAPTSVLLLHQRRYALIGAINATTLVAQLLVLVMLTPRLGMLAGACAWLVWAAIQLAAAGYHERTAVDP